MLRVSKNVRAAMLLGAVLAGCSSGDDAEEEIAPRPGLISFNPLYSAFGGDQTYQVTPYVPLVGADAAQGADPIDAKTLKWSVKSQYVIDKGEFLKPDGTPALPGGRLLVTKAAGTTTVEVTGTTLGGVKDRKSVV